MAELPEREESQAYAEHHKASYLQGYLQDSPCQKCAAARELKEETGLTALNLQLKGISGFTNPTKAERYVYYDFLCEDFEGELLTE